MIIILIGMIIFGLFSCSTAAKDQRALDRVEAKPDLLNTAGVIYIKGHPFRCDSAPPIQLPGKIIEVPVIMTVKDSQAINQAIDSMQQLISNKSCDVAISAAYEAGMKYALKTWPQTKQVDTFKIKVQLQSEIDRMNDSFYVYKLKSVSLVGQLLVEHNDTLAEKSLRNKFKWALITLLVVLGVWSGYSIYKKFTPTGVAATASTSVLSSIKNIFK